MPPHQQWKHIPTSAFWDIKRTIGNVKKEIPFDIPDSVWERHSKHLLRQWKKTSTNPSWPSTQEVYDLRKLLDGLVIGPIDKNLGELSFVCPKLYEKALGSMYSKENGYVRAHQWKCPKTKKN